ncbi:carbohydrate-binding domain-containing protein [Jatrophihabitans sp.]|uniref:carbohydrate-binding domain-containing protein n=1 Tax=Jatrophihabitans sp. TaxID=1932789 RepID=UPI002F22099F
MRKSLVPSGIVAAVAVGLVALSLSSGGSASAAAVGQLQAEVMTSIQGYGASVYNDTTASGGQALLVDSNVTVQGTLNLTSAATGLTVRAKTDGTAASMTVTVDGVAFAAQSVPAQTWTDYAFTRSLASGNHAVKIAFTNACCRNLYLDVVTGQGTVVTPSPGTKATAYLTGYSVYDNDPIGSTAICCGVIHTEAGGTGTYADPITLAVGVVGTTLDVPAGTRFHVPALRKYFMVEDSCAACHSGTRPAGTSIWVDAWVDGRTSTNAQADACMNSITGVHDIYQNPVSNLAVVSGVISANGGCATVYSETVVYA